MLDSPMPISHYESIESKALHVKEYAIACMNQLQGWCSQEKASILIDLALKIQPQVIVEIGVWGGKSLVPMACVLKANQKGIAYGIDPWSNEASIEEVIHPDNKSYWGQVDHEAVKLGLVHKIWDFGLQDTIELIQSTSEDAPLIYDIDILHIDGNHSEKTSYFDVMKWVPLVKKGGFIIFDDMTWYENGVFTTARAVEWLNENCMKFAEFSDIAIWGIWVKL
ncbi:MAG: class I SAM-dependent methyltransferase [Verrucomicrobiota bacterium]|nr:class I SAM-dependent methyltransferase [Verrucomicrobiota bacterium]